VETRRKLGRLVPSTVESAKLSWKSAEKLYGATSFRGLISDRLSATTLRRYEPPLQG